MEKIPTHEMVREYLQDPIKMDKAMGEIAKLGNINFVKMSEIIKAGKERKILYISSAAASDRYLNEGFIDYIAKSFKKEQIKEKLDKTFNV